MAPPKQKTSIGSRAPTREIGAVANGAMLPSSLSAWSRFVDDEEYVPELTWPNSVRVYHEMRSDSQLAALYQATVLAIRRFKWSIDPNDAPEEMVRKLSADYNLPVLGDEPNQRIRPKQSNLRDGPQQRRKRRFAFDRHLRLAMNAGIYGHYYFEQVGQIDADGYWHLTHLRERPPRTIADFKIAEDGGLVSIVQNVVKGGLTFQQQIPEIPVDRLVGYVVDQEGANWVGRSWFRDCYKNWVIKDRLVRIDAVNHERAGGVPYIEAHPGATMDEIKQLNEMAKGFRIGDTSGGAVPAGAKLNIAKGTNSSVVDSIRYHDEAMARRFMLMVMQLGQTQTGSRALGSTFIDFWAHGLSAIATWFADTFNEHVIEDDIDWNFGEDVEQVPLLSYEYDPEFVAQDLATMITAQAIVMDDVLEEYIRKEMGLPEKDTASARPTAQPVDQQLEEKSNLKIKEIDAQPKPQPAGAGSTKNGGGGTAKASAADPRVLPPGDAADAQLNKEEG